MNIREFKESLDYLVCATKKGERMTPFIWGHAGVGKTSLMKQYAKAKGLKFFAFYLGTQSDTGDILGLAEFVRNEAGEAVATKFAIPAWLKETIDYCNANPDFGAIIFLDEFNRARRDILQGMFSFALDGRFHTIQLPPNCHIVAAGNPPTDEYFVTDTDETALMGRFIHVKLEPTTQEWLEYAKEQGINSNVIEFIRNQPALLQDSRKDFKLPVKVDPRAIERWSHIMDQNPPPHILEQLMHGVIGLERTVAYQQFLASQDKPLTGEEILSGKKVKQIQKWSSPVDAQASLLNLTCENLHVLMKTMNAAKTLMTKKEQKNVIEFLELIPKDIAYICFDKITKDRVEGELNATWLDFFNGGEYKQRCLDLVRSAKPEVETKTA